MPQTLIDSLLAWFTVRQRDLPWRRTYDPYHVLVSEVMLQQTQMDRVVVYFNRWLEKFPTLGALAAADEETVLKLWEGLGYYRRARNLLATARILVADHDGRIPENLQALEKLPGIGRYTAGALMSVAFNHPYPAVDANVERVFARLFNIAVPVKDKNAHAFIRHKARELLPEGRARMVNQALMELGALVCLPANPRCEECPLLKGCEARRLGLERERPVRSGARQSVRIEMATGVLVHQGRVFIQKRLDEEVWANLWEFPGGRVKQDELPAEALVREFMEETELAINAIEWIGKVRHSYTIYRVVQHCFFCRPANGRVIPVLHAAQDYRWVTREELGEYAFPSGHRKLIAQLASDRRFAELLEK